MLRFHPTMVGPLVTSMGLMGRAYEQTKPVENPKHLQQETKADSQSADFCLIQRAWLNAEPSARSFGEGLRLVTLIFIPDSDIC